MRLFCLVFVILLNVRLGHSRGWWQRARELPHLTRSDFLRSRRVRFDDTDDDSNSLENSGFFEGDLLGITSESVNMELALRTAIRYSRYYWPEAKIPYEVSTNYTKNQRARIAAAFEEFEEKTCIRFVPTKNEEENSIFITPDLGPKICGSYVGMRGEHGQKIWLGSKCLRKLGTIEHELMHCLGFFHEQNRSDRDDHVRVYYKNIMARMSVNFKRYSFDYATHLDTPYDYDSVMHYARKEMSKNGRFTIIPKRSGVRIGQRKRFSSTDLQRINRLYECENV